MTIETRNAGQISKLRPKEEIKDFKDLEVWKAARELRGNCMNWPKHFLILNGSV